VTNISKYILNVNASIKDAIKVIDRGAAQVALVVDSDQRLLGVVTDGDIRRAIIGDASLNTVISEVMTVNPIVLYEGSSKAEALQLMSEMSIHHVPVVNSTMKIKHLFVLDDLLKKPSFSNSVILMAGGSGTRLKPLTDNCPKPMLRVNGTPILEIILKRCISAGFTNFFISVNYLKEQLINYFDDGKKWGIKINYLEEKEFLGTCGCLKLLPSEISKDIIVMNGDIITDLDLDRLIRFHMKANNSLTICARNHRVKIPFAVLNSHKEQLCSFVEKPMFNYQVNAGVYVLKKETISCIPDQFFNMTDLIQALLNKNTGVGVFPIHENWTDIGNPDDFNKVCLS
jgi:dTDP-glucose pyrophosphorylase